MNLLEEILKFSEEKLPLWQRDAARRLFQKEGYLSQDDHDELYAILKSEHGFPIPDGITPRPLAGNHLPTILSEDDTVVIESIYDLKYVNKIADGQKLSFLPKGMTIIFGDNGTGKSGYARVMKKACRARDQSEKIHPDAGDPSEINCIPEATFNININGFPKPVKWFYGTESPDDLSSIAVFDSHCARAYLTTEQEVAYLPYGLDILENLANVVIPMISKMLDDEIAGIDTDTEPFTHLHGETEVGQLLSHLDHTTDVTKIKSLGTFSNKQANRLQEIDKALGESDPSAKATELYLSASRLKGLVAKLDASLSWVSDKAIKELKVKYDNAKKSKKAENQAAIALRAGENLLEGTGDQLWRIMFDAARKYSTEVAYPDSDFPNTAEGALCPLCQQPLNDAGARLQRFEEYITHDIARKADSDRLVLKEAIKKLKDIDLSIGLEDSLTKEVDLLQNGLANTCKNFQASIMNRKKWMLEGLQSQNCEEVPTVIENPRHDLRSLAARQILSARTYDRVCKDSDRKALNHEREELSACKGLAVCRDSVISLLNRIKTKQMLETCKADLKTRPISDKSRELSSIAISTNLASALDSEFDALGVGHIKTKLKQRNERGKTKLQLLLDIPTTNKLEEILSEGEQRAIAIGSFLAELSLVKHSNGIVFDDPVSSLDHKRRGRVAKRLAKESLSRQVLIFTHDLIFLHQLKEECEKLGTHPQLAFLEVVDGYAGKVNDGLPWAHQGYMERIDNLEKEQRRLQRLPWPSDPSENLKHEIMQLYSYLRATIERVVQDFILNSTVRRFENYIRVNNLKGVVGLEQAEIDETLRLYQRCSDLIDAHDPSSARNDPPPTPYDLKQDIESLKNIIEIIRNKRQSRAHPIISAN